MTWETYLREKAGVIEEALDKLLPEAESYPSAVHQAMRYSLMAGGKRLRAVLTLAACEAVGGAWLDAVPAACAVEFMHTYSLIHDDLPAMDDDDYRRGKPTCHRVFGEAVAILAGDALLTQAFFVLSQTALDRVKLRSRYVAAMAELSRAAGSQGLIGGQVVDMESEGKAVGLETVEYIHLHKTSALLQAATVAGGIIGGASRAQVEELQQYGRHLGLAFQITDDILDIIGDPRSTGKDQASDARRGKATYPAVCGIEAACQRVATEISLAAQSLASLGGSGEILAAAAQWVGEREK